jgi:predicted Zn-dependent protease
MEQGDIDGAQRAFEQAVALAPEKTEWRFWHALRLIEHGRVQQGIEILKALVAREPQYRTLWERLPGTGRFRIDPQVWEQVRQALADRR